MKQFFAFSIFLYFILISAKPIQHNQLHRHNLFQDSIKKTDSVCRVAYKFNYKNSDTTIVCFGYGKTKKEACQNGLEKGLKIVHQLDEKTNNQ